MGLIIGPGGLTSWLHPLLGPLALTLASHECIDRLNIGELSPVSSVKSLKGNGRANERVRTPSYEPSRPLYAVAGKRSSVCA
jgi:hypothetical protein